MSKIRGWVVPSCVVVGLVGVSIFGGGGNESQQQHIWTAEAVTAAKDEAKAVVEDEIDAALPAARELMEQEAIELTDQYLIETVNLLQQADLVADQIRLQTIYQESLIERDQTGTPLVEILERKLQFHTREAMQIAADHNINAYGGTAEARNLYAANLNDAKLLIQLIGSVKAGVTPITSELSPSDVWPRVEVYLLQSRRTRGLMRGDTEDE